MLTRLTRSSQASNLATAVRGAILRAIKLRSDKQVVFYAKMAVGLLVLVAVGRYVSQTLRKVQDRGLRVHVDPGWIALAIVLYLAGLIAFGVFFWRVLRDSPTPVPLLPALRAYLISHLGKYVPGKALVVVMRVALVVPYRAGTATAAFATLYETLVMMATGGLFAALGFALVPIERWPALVALGLGFGLLVVVDPSVFPKISRMISAPLRGIDAEAFPRVTRRLLLEGIGWSLLGWCLLGLSQVAVVWAIAPTGVAVERWPLIIASVALATVAGFVVAVFPGGLGVREGVLMATLGPAVGADTAVLAALILRLAWVLGEFVAALPLLVARPSVPLPEATAS